MSSAIEMISRCARGQGRAAADWATTLFNIRVRGDCLNLWPDAYLDPGVDAAIRRQSLMSVYWITSVNDRV